MASDSSSQLIDVALGFSGIRYELIVQTISFLISLDRAGYISNKSE
jgi:hypothetical protein